MPDTTQQIVEFINQCTVALGIETPVEVEQTADGPRLNLTGEQAELLARHRGEPIKALQHIVDERELFIAPTLNCSKCLIVCAEILSRVAVHEIRHRAVISPMAG